RARADVPAGPAPIGGRDGVAREVPPALGQTLRRVVQGCRGTDTKGEGAMNARIESKPGPVKNRTTVERKSDREVVVTRTINGPARIVFEAFTKAELLKRWWVPKSMGMTLLSCEVEPRVGGKYRLVFDHDPEPFAFFGTYVEVKPYSRLAWTNEEGGEGGSVTTVTFEE